MFNKKNKIIILAISIFVLLLFVVLICFNLFFYQTTNVKINTNFVSITPKVKGIITELNAQDKQEIKKGEIIAQIAPEKYEEVLFEAQKKLKTAQEKLKLSNADIEKMGSIAASNENSIENAKKNLENANSDFILYKNAFQDGSVTKQDLEKATKNLNIAKEQYYAAQNNLKTTKESLNSAIYKKNSQYEEINKLIAQVEQAKLDLSNTTLISPINGIIVNKNVKIGTLINSQEPIITIIPYECEIIGKFDNKQIKKIKINQEAIVKIGFKEFKGKVESIQNNEVKVKLIFNKDIAKCTSNKDDNAILKIKIK